MNSYFIDDLMMCMPKIASAYAAVKQNSFSF